MKTKIVVACLTVVLLVASALICVFATGRSHALYESRGTFYCGLFGRENESLSHQDWSGPDRFCLFKEILWDNRPADFEQRVLRRLHDAYCRMGDDEAMKAVKSIAFHKTDRSMDRFELSVVAPDSALAIDVANASMEVIADIDLEGARSRKETIVRQLTREYERNIKEVRLLEEKMGALGAGDEKLGLETRIAQLTNSIEYLEGQVALYQEMDARTNTMFRIMVPARVAVDVVTRNNLR